MHGLLRYSEDYVSIPERGAKKNYIRSRRLESTGNLIDVDQALRFIKS